MSQPSGVGSPERAAILTLPAAATLVEKSMTIGFSGCHGMPAATGLVLRNGAEPPSGATAGFPPASLTIIRATIPCRAGSPT